MNADSLFIAGDEVTGANMYAYCNGNPVMLWDPSGRVAESSINWLVGIVACIAIAEAIVRFLPEVLWEPLAEAAGKALGQFTTPDSIVNAARTIIGNIAWLGEQIISLASATGLTANAIGNFIATGQRIIGDIWDGVRSNDIFGDIFGLTTAEAWDMIADFERWKEYLTYAEWGVLGIFGAMLSPLGLAVGGGLAALAGLDNIVLNKEFSDMISQLKRYVGIIEGYYDYILGFFNGQGINIPIDWIAFLLR